MVDPAPNYFTVAELRGMDSALDDVARYPESVLIEMRELVEQELERKCNVAFVPRQTVATVDGTGTRTLDLPASLLRAVSSVTNADDTGAGAVLDITGARVDGSSLWRPERWPAGDLNLTVTYDHGYDRPPLRIKRAALTLAKVLLIRGPIDDRATQVSIDGGIVNLATPGLFGSIFGIPEVDAAARAYTEHYVF